MRPFVVLKFGGTSVSRRERWQTIAERIGHHQAEGACPVVVCSALAGTTDALEALLLTARRQEPLDAPLADLRHRHVTFAADLGVDAAVIEDELHALTRLSTGVSLLGEASPRIRAQVLATGERMLTALAAQYLAAQGIEVTALDARDALTSTGTDEAPRRHLAATVPHGPDPELQARLSGAAAVLTQGFVARDPGGDTVLLGRGGSDVSAAILAARLGAERCEIWTDVPGMFTADPRSVPAARLLQELDYAEALEVATMGAKVLHPRALAPVRACRIPLWVRCTQRPDIDGTRISAAAPSGPAQVKAISSRRGLVLVSMETLGMWQQVGFLADVFAVFARHGLSVDTVSTSETNVTVSLDPSANAIERAVLDALLADLRPLCQAALIEPCASVSLVGRGIRSILHRLAPVLETFEELRVHLVSQAASDLNLTFVVDESTADTLISKLHALLFAHRGADALLGPTWRELFTEGESEGATRLEPPWWQAARPTLVDVASRGTPVYVYDASTVRARARGLRSLHSIDRVLFAMKANPHPELLAVLAEEGLGFECVSPGELARVVDLGVRVLYTPNFAPRRELAGPFPEQVTVTLDNLHPLVAWPELWAGREVFVRLDPDRGRGHHAKVRTAGARSKFGIASDELDTLSEAAERAGARIVGLHAHTGSGVLDPTAWRDNALFLAQVAERFPHVRVLDLGGGLGVPERPGHPVLDLAALDEALASVKVAHPHLELWLEPGRYLVAEAGVLLARVTQTKQKGPVRYAGVDAGMHTLLRPALYGAYHHVENLSAEGAGPEVTVVGPICETGDVLARDRRLGSVEEGHVLLFGTAGAYGAAMASDYNLRGRPREVVLGEPAAD